MHVYVAISLSPICPHFTCINNLQTEKWQTAGPSNAPKSLLSVGETGAFVNYVEPVMLNNDGPFLDSKYISVHLLSICSDHRVQSHCSLTKWGQLSYFVCNTEIFCPCSLMGSSRLSPSTTMLMPEWTSLGWMPGSTEIANSSSCHSRVRQTSFQRVPTGGQAMHVIRIWLRVLICRFIGLSLQLRHGVLELQVCQTLWLSITQYFMHSDDPSSCANQDPNETPHNLQVKVLQSLLCV